MNSWDIVAPKAEDSPIYKKLYSQGYVWLNGGSFSDVFMKPKGKSVVKVFGDKPFLSFLNAAKKANNPHFPKLVKPLSKSNGKFLAEIEKLDELPKSAPGEIRDIIKLVKLKNLDSKHRLFKKYPKLYEAITIIKGLVESDFRSRLDMFPNHTNMMMRGNIPVFLDPISMR